MPTPGHNRNLRPTILDRLIDDHPDSTTESITNHFTTVAQLKQTVTRDLEALLNTRQETLEPLHQAFCELQHSLMTYGLPDFTTSNLQNAQDHNAIRRALEQAITTFEPRLDRVRSYWSPLVNTTTRYSFALTPYCASIPRLNP